MSLAVTGVLSSRAAQEHGKRALAAAAHPTRRTIFFAAGQVVDELDARDGSLVSRILSDLPGTFLESSIAIATINSTRKQVEACWAWRCK